VLPSTAHIKGVFRVAPVFRPRLVTMITGRSVSLNVSQPAYFLNGFTQAHTSIICMQQHHLWGMFFNQRHARGGMGATAEITSGQRSRKASVAKSVAPVSDPTMTAFTYFWNSLQLAAKRYAWQQLEESIPNSPFAIRLKSRESQYIH
jgi:hypothetical protein